MRLFKKYWFVALPAIIFMAGVVLASKAPKKQSPVKQVQSQQQPTPQPSSLPKLSKQSSSSPDFSQYAAGGERKKAFFSYFLPLIEARNAEIAKTRGQLQRWHKARASLGEQEARKVQSLAKEYGMKRFDAGNEIHWQALLRRVDVVPPSLALAQAANESAWGTSRFARKAHNFYGQWCFAKGCGLVPQQRSAGKSHEVAKFSSPAGSVKSYINNLNRHSAYSHLRKIRERMRTAHQALLGTELAKGLVRYSERGKAYVTELQAMIRHNKLQQYDLR